MNQKETMTMTKHNTKNIVEALSKFQEEANVAKKESKNPFFKSTYAALEDVIAAANQGAKYGLAFTQTIDYDKKIIDGVVDTTMYVTTILMHKDSDTEITSRYLIVPKNNKYDDSQALGSAITYAKRYSLQAIYGLPSEDDDANSSTHNPKVTKPSEEDMRWITFSEKQRAEMLDIVQNAAEDMEKRLDLLEQFENDNKVKWDLCKKAHPTAGDQITVKCSYLKSQLKKQIKKKDEVNNAKPNDN